MLHYGGNTVNDQMILKRLETYWYFQNVFALDFGHFQSSNTVKGGTNSCKLVAIQKFKTYGLLDISGVVVRSVCHYWLRDVLKG